MQYSLMLRVACANFPVSMKRYFQELSAVEVNRTFYVIPRDSTLQTWREKAPKDFVFSVKANRQLTHTARMDISSPEGASALEGTLRAARILGARYILFQTPPSFCPPNLKTLKDVLGVASSQGYLVGYEPRGQGWKGREAELADALRGVASHVVDPFISKEVHSEGFHYFRLHGLGERPYRYRYSDAELAWLRDFLRPMEEEEVFLVFNNTNMYEDCKRFAAMLKSGV